MNYLFENLGPERFQEFCQALVASQFPTIQCLPIAQPDGGRDAVVFRFGKTRKDFLVFQVKYVREPAALADPHKWLAEAVEGEVDKVQKLIPKGAKYYFLLTNVAGTAHAEVGSVDRVQSILNQLNVPAMCWWRDDLSRRLESNWQLKWSYPEVLSGKDMLQFVAAHGFSENKERREAALRAFLRHQYEEDKSIRFKQVDLQNNLLDLFVDVPITTVASRDRRESMLRANAGSIEDDSQIYFGQSHESPAHWGSATFLLQNATTLPKMLLEGAPGQGKSTVGQYVSQVHRMRLLDATAELSRIEQAHRTGPLKFPIRVDIRDLATWLRGDDPFTAEGRVSSAVPRHPSLEAFLAALIHHNSGGAEFQVHDLQAVAQVMSLLLVLDGLDEVADIKIRGIVVDEILKGTKRLDQNAAHLQVVVTSRPSAFANSPGLPEDPFRHFELDHVTKPQIVEYANRWCKARGLNEHEADDVKHILRDKLDQPHLRDLARNTMQLTILLSLIHTRGSSLPDKRTALYQSYMDLYFNREAEKSSIVRMYRELLNDIHQHLAWLLHSQAEQGQDRGSITAERLKAVVREFLVVQGRDPSLCEELFPGIVERVGALVSRVQGTYEFEVQPLREFFAAKYLYETAPYSPPGNEKRATKPDRFDAIARNFYWFNVTRFFAGCFSKGELAGLGERVEELAKEPIYRSTYHPKSLAALVLADWSFAQNPKVTAKIVSLLADGAGMFYLAGRSRLSSGHPMELPTECGREELLRQCTRLLMTDLPRDLEESVALVIKANTAKEERETLWLDLLGASESSDRARLLRVGKSLDTLETLEIGSLRSLLSDCTKKDECWSALLDAGRFDVWEDSEQGQRECVNFILDEVNVLWPDRRYAKSYLGLPAMALNPLLANRFVDDFHIPVRVFDAFKQETLRALPEARTQVERDCLQVAEAAAKSFKCSRTEWANSLEPHANIVEAAHSSWGDHLLLYCLANNAAGIHSKAETAAEFRDLFEGTVSLCHRARHARLRSGSLRWWKTQMERVRDEDDGFFACLLLLSWGTDHTLMNCASLLDAHLRSLSNSHWSVLFDSVSIRWYGENRKPSKIDVGKLPPNLSSRAAAVLAVRAGGEHIRQLWDRYMGNCNDRDPILAGFRCKVLLQTVEKDPSRWGKILAPLKEAHLRASGGHGWWLSEANESLTIPLKQAESIVINAASYPLYVVTAAETVCRNHLSQIIVPIGKIAMSEGWFAIQ